ncbi:LytR/AlgR family response regulator transcription factor [Pedobacter aquatilis]|uniref:LytR/AlgR family response regulator transcription factor n=1 Tax=Pedobacter aquatilis TaxID=351343 RepID=UPI00292D96C2|nr:response regulator [Pedobacter aquatilis]
MKKATAAKYSCVILDDDAMSVEILKQYISRIETMELTASFTEPVEAAAAFLDYEMVDFLFLDIQMEVSGLDIARMFRDKARFIVFVTGYKEFALEAFENGDAYLVKPVDFKTLLRAIKHVTARSAKQSALRL